MVAEFMTVSGRRVNLLEMRPDDVCIEDIAHHLSWTGRYGGAVEAHYNNGQHSVLVSQLVEAEGLSPHTAERRWGPSAADPSPSPEDLHLLALCGLLHDGAEAYTGDITRPMKDALRFAAHFYGLQSPIDVIEAAVEAVVEQVFELPPWSLRGGPIAPDGMLAGVDVHRVVKRADNLALKIEDSILRPHPKTECPLPPELMEKLCLQSRDTVWTREQAREHFLARFHALKGPPSA